MRGRWEEIPLERHLTDAEQAEDEKIECEVRRRCRQKKDALWRTFWESEPVPNAEYRFWTKRLLALCQMRKEEEAQP